RSPSRSRRWRSKLPPFLLPKKEATPSGGLFISIQRETLFRLLRVRVGRVAHPFHHVSRRRRQLGDDALHLFATDRLGIEPELGGILLELRILRHRHDSRPQRRH